MTAKAAGFEVKMPKVAARLPCGCLIREEGWVPCVEAERDPIAHRNEVIDQLAKAIVTLRGKVVQRLKEQGGG